MKNKKAIISAIVILLVLVVIILFLYPRSLSDVGFEVKSISVVVVEDDIGLDNSTYVYSNQDPELKSIMQVLDGYSYHLSFQSVVSRQASTNGNQAGYWLNIYLYSEPDQTGDFHQILLGGTGDIIVGQNVYRIGYIGNKAELKMMDELCHVIIPEE